MRLSKQERLLILSGLLLIAGILFFSSMSYFIRTVSSWSGVKPESTLTPGVFDNPKHWSNLTPTATPYVFLTSTPALWRTPSPVPTVRLTPFPTAVPRRTPTPWVKNTPVPAGTRPTPDRGIATVEAMLFGCGGLSEYEMQRIYWSVVVAQDEAERQAEAQGRRTVDYALADLAVMTYFSITARILECIKDKGNKEVWPIPSRP